MATVSNQKQSLYSLKEALEIINPTAVLSQEEILDHAILGDVKLCIKADFNYSVIGRIDIRLLGLANDPDSDGHIIQQYDWPGVFSEERTEDTNVIAVFLTKSDCEGVKYHKVFPQIVFRSAYKIQGSNTAVEVTPFEVLYPDISCFLEKDLSFSRGLMELHRFCLYPREPRYGKIYSTSQIVLSFDMPVPIDLSLDNLCVSECELLKFLEKIHTSKTMLLVRGKKEAHYLSPKMQMLHKVILECWMNPTLYPEKYKQPSKYTIESKIIKFLGVKKTQAGKLQRIICPDYARKPNASIDKTTFISQQFHALVKIGEEYWPEGYATNSSFKRPHRDDVAAALMNKFSFPDYLAEAGAEVLEEEIPPKLVSRDRK